PPTAASRTSSTPATPTPPTPITAPASSKQPPSSRTVPPPTVSIPHHTGPTVAASGPLTAPAQATSSTKGQTVPPRPFAAVTRGGSAPNPNSSNAAPPSITPAAPARGYSAVAAAVVAGAGHEDAKSGATSVEDKKGAGRTSGMVAAKAETTKSGKDKDEKSPAAVSTPDVDSGAATGTQSDSKQPASATTFLPPSAQPITTPPPTTVQTQLPPTTAAVAVTAVTTPSQTQSDQGSATSASQAESRLPPSLEDLVNSFEAAKARSSKLSEDAPFLRAMLDTSFNTIPDPSDWEKPRKYVPLNPYPTPLYYPQMPSPVFDDPLIFERFDIDTLFFIFYYQQGTYQQFLAARELKRQSWRFHKKYLTWFQRHEEPKVITDEFEQGTYIYFDYEGAWVQRKKTDFRFEYRFLEDAEV
ncbi:general negative regulator of transcription subunit 5, partial [Gonapodya sp. JEL0774]